MPSLDFGDDFWSKERKLSGKSIDALRGQNVPGNSRIIDRTLVPLGIVSHKSTDLRCKSYSRPGAVYRIGMSFVRKLARYVGEIRRDHRIKATYHLTWAVEKSDARRLLEWFVPRCGVTEVQEQELARVIEAARPFGVEVVIFKI